MKSFTADPSRRNSGLLQTPNSTPAFFPESSSRIGITISRIVPGKMVLRITTVWRADLFLSALPICSQMRRMYFKSRFPFAWLGVPTQTNDSSVSRIADPDRWSRAASRFHGARDNFSDLRFNDWRLAGIDQINLGRDGIDANDFVTVIGKAPGRNRSNVTHSKDADFQVPGLSQILATGSARYLTEIQPKRKQVERMQITRSFERRPSAEGARCSDFLLSATIISSNSEIPSPARWVRDQLIKGILGTGTSIFRYEPGKRSYSHRRPRVIMSDIEAIRLVAVSVPPTFAASAWDGVSLTLLRGSSPREGSYGDQPKVNAGCTQYQVARAVFSRRNTQNYSG